MSTLPVLPVLAATASVWGWLGANIDLDDLAADLAELTVGVTSEDDRTAILVSLLDQLVPEEALGEWADQLGDAVYPLVAAQVARMMGARSRRRKAATAMGMVKAGLAKARAAQGA